MLSAPRIVEPPAELLENRNSIYARLLEGEVTFKPISKSGLITSTTLGRPD